MGVGWASLTTDRRRDEVHDVVDHLTTEDSDDALPLSGLTVVARTAQMSTADLDARLAAAGIPAAQIRDLAGLVSHPQLSARDRWRTVDTERGSIRALLPPMTFDDVEMWMGAGACAR